MNTTRDDFDPIPSTRHRIPVGVGSLKQAEEAADALAVPVAMGKEPPDELGTDAAGLASAGFTGERGQTLVRTREDGPVRVAVGTGAPEKDRGNWQTQLAEGDAILVHGPWQALDELTRDRDVLLVDSPELGSRSRPLEYYGAPRVRVVVAEVPPRR